MYSPKKQYRSHPPGRLIPQRPAPAEFQFRWFRLIEATKEVNPDFEFDAHDSLEDCKSGKGSPDCNKCKCCPFGRKPEDRQPRVIIYDDPTELDNGGYYDDVDVQLDLEIITEKIKHKNQLIAEVFSLCIAYGYSISEIAEELRMPERKVRYLMEQAKEIAKKVLD